MASKNIDRTSRGLATAMFEELDALRNGKSTPQQAQAKVKLAVAICNITRLELEYARFAVEERAGLPAAELKALTMG